MDLSRAFLPRVAEKGSERTLEATLLPAGSTADMLPTPTRPLGSPLHLQRPLPHPGARCSLSKGPRMGMLGSEFENARI